MELLACVGTDVAALYFYDPAVLSAYEENDETGFDLSTIQGVRRGQFFGFQLGGDGGYRVRITDGVLTPDEQDYAAGVLHVGLEVSSGLVCAGGYGFERGEPREGESLAIPPGRYNVTVYEVLWHVSAQWWRNEGEGAAVGAPADFVLVLERRHEESFSPNFQELRLDTMYLPGVDGLDSEPWHFPSDSRRVGTEVGMELTTQVIKGQSGFYLKRSGPENYRGVLPDYEGLKWRDTIRIRVTDVDHERGLFYGQLLKKLG